MRLRWAPQNAWRVTAIEYAKTREQFKTLIADFGAIKNKLAEMAIYIWASGNCFVPGIEMDRR